MARTHKFSSVETAILTDGQGRNIGLPAVAGLLTAKQIAFARYVSFGLSYVAAVRAAGYQPASPESCKAMGSELASDPRIAELVRVFCAALLKTSGPGALAALTRIIADPKSKDSDKIKAAVAIINKSQPTRTAHQIEADVTHHVEQERRPTLADLYVEAGIETPANLRLPPPAAEPVDAEFEELEPAAARAFANYSGRDSEEDPTALDPETGEAW